MSQPNELEIATDPSAGVVDIEAERTARLERVRQLGDDAYAHCNSAQDDLGTVRDKLERTAAGEREPDPEPLPMPSAAAEIIQTPTPRRALVLTGVAIVSLVTGVLIYAGVATSTQSPAIVVAAPMATGGEPTPTTSVAMAMPDADAPNPAGADLGRSIYAARFSTAPASERTCLARAVYYEARGEAVEGQMAVAQVILNRARSHKWPKSICGVVNQGIERGEKCQFSFACFSHLTEPSGDLWEQAKTVAEQAVAGQAWLRELIEATHYHTTAVAPVWKAGLVELATIGTHVFYREPDGLRVASGDPVAYTAAAAADEAKAKAAKDAAREKALMAAKAARLKAMTASAAPDAPAAKKAESNDGWSARVFQAQ
jgi:Cell Wall Hydrolase